MPPSNEETKAGPPGSTMTLEFEAAVFHPDSVLSAAHVLARSMRVWLAPDGRGGTTARLAPADGAPPEGMADRFRDEVAAQELRRRVSAANRGLREYIVTQALLSAGGERAGGAGSGGPALSPEEDAEIDRLIAEVEKDIESKAAQFEAGGDVGRTWEESRGADAAGPGPERTP